MHTYAVEGVKENLCKTKSLYTSVVLLNSND